ncbi:MAG: toll/interleukin-1 receptor domain-containing protein [Chloroflexi bacterium]|nr:toll/interleukin-1 receptor domain-containing protein [Chloroflexota bacterium]MBI3742552.1 toll/interleukin-1 receptor domain-containing protein [Chloroflexota bacterium]
MAYKVFISSLSEDKDLANDLARRLKQAGAVVFLAEASIRAGENIAIKINEGLRESDEVIVLFSASSIDSPWVLSEMGAAFGLHKKVTPVIVGINENELPPLVKKLSYIRYPDVENHFAKLGSKQEHPAPKRKAKVLAETRGNYATEKKLARNSHGSSKRLAKIARDDSNSR